LVIADLLPRRLACRTSAGHATGVKGEIPQGRDEGAPLTPGAPALREVTPPREGAYRQAMDHAAETPILAVYASDAVPTLIKAQILSFMRIEWADGYSGKQQFRDEIWPEGRAIDTVHFVLEQRGLVIAHAGVLSTAITHAENRFTVGAPTGLFTFPNFRRLGHGLDVLRAATEHIEQTGVDVGLTTSRVPELYEKAGWQPIRGSQLTYGPAGSPKRADETVLMLFLSEEAKAHRESFEATDIYVGTGSW
jgi:GNAT superfamily N-acetyltransferase